MSILANNVVLMRQKQENQEINIHNDIHTFLKRHNVGKGDKYVGTAAEYFRDIKRFFNVMHGMEFSELKVLDLDLLPKDIMSFQTFLIDSGYKSNTVNRNINTLRALYSFFEENRYKYKDHNNETVYILASIFNGVDKVQLNDEETYGMYTHEEIKEIIQLSKSLPNGVQKSLAIEFASKTAFRIQAIADLTTKDFRKEDETWVVKTIDKKKVHEKSISTDLYNRLMANKADNKIFGFTTKTLERTITQLNFKMGLDPDRNLTFHSIKKYSMGEVYHITGGDPLAVAEHGNHSSFETSKKYYLLFSKSYGKMPCLLIGEEINVEPLEKLTHEALLELINGSSRELQYELLSNLKKNNKAKEQE